VAPDPVRPPPWHSGEVAPATPQRPPSSGSIVLFDDPNAGPILFSQDLELMRAEVASECLAARTSKSRDILGSLVINLYLSVVDPAEATDALIRGDCAPSPDIVREMVAKGGEEVMTPVVERARALSPADARRKIDAAASEGLARYAAARGFDVGPTRGTRGHAMAYYPSAGLGMRLERSSGQDDHLYRRAVSGYGIYTFVLIGGRLERLPETDRARHRELFRLVETYTGVGGQDEVNPRPDAHVFLIPIDPELGEAPLFSQISADLSDRMRLKLINDLRLRGQAVLAERLERSPGPFLIAGLEPNLIPAGLDAPRLMADLSGVGVEHLYDVVDAFDHVIPSDLNGESAGLLAIRDRLSGLLPAGAADPETAATAADVWLFMLEATRDAGAAVAGMHLLLGAASVERIDQPGA
jgi:hypothetical protein